MYVYDVRKRKPHGICLDLLKSESTTAIVFLRRSCSSKIRTVLYGAAFSPASAKSSNGENGFSNTFGPALIIERFIAYLLADHS